MKPSLFLKFVLRAQYIIYILKSKVFPFPTESILMMLIFKKQEKLSRKFALSSLKSSPQHSSHKWSIFFLRNLNKLVCSWTHNGAASMGGSCYHHQISSHTLTHGPVVISRLVDHTLLMLSQTMYTHSTRYTHSHKNVHTRPFAVHIHTQMKRGTNTILLQVVNSCVFVAVSQKPFSLTVLGKAGMAAFNKNPSN